VSRTRGMAVISLVARRELRERARSRSFMISTLFILLVVSAVGVLPALLEEDDAKPRRIEVIGLGAEELAAQLATSGAALDLEVAAVASDDAERSRRALLGEQIDAVVFTDGRLFFRRHGEAEVVQATQEALRAWLLPSRLEGLGLDAESAAALVAGPSLDVATLLTEPENESDRLIVAVGGVVLLLLAITTYGQWVLQGVVEEKTSRVVEVLLVTMRPYQLLAGKVLGIGLLGLAQLAVTVTLGLGVASAGGLIDLPDRAGALFALELLWFALGFAFYAVAYATAGSLVSRQEEAANVALPVTIALMASYFIAFTAVLEDANGLVPRVATFVPLTAPIVIPARAAVGAVSAAEHIAALTIMLAAIYLLVRVAGRIYAGGVLRTGPTVRLRDAWRQRERERPARP
jgi:ABC-2 type transport system permease protein